MPIPILSMTWNYQVPVVQYPLSATDTANSLLRESREAVANNTLEIPRERSAAQVKMISLTFEHLCPVYRPS